MSTFVLKIIAITAMLIDHVGAVLVSSSKYPEAYLICRSIGRLAFPIFVFLIVEGFHHTRDIKKYLRRLGIFALISEIPFDLAFYHMHYGMNAITDIKDIYDVQAHAVNSDQLETVLLRFNEHQNVFFTLFLGLLLIYLISEVEKNLKNVIVGNIIDAAATVLICAAAYFLNTDYDIAGILMIVAFYLFRGSKALMTICLLIICGTILSNLDYFKQTGNVLAIIPVLATFAIIPIAFYNGKKGKNMKYFFYIFYPAHLLLLFFISRFI